MTAPKSSKVFTGLRGRRRRRREPRRKSVAIVYRRDGQTIRHVDFTIDTLQQELDRLCGIMGFLSRLMRPTRLKTNHPIIRHVRYVLGNAPASVGQGLTIEQMTQEIGRLNYVMNYALQTMNVMRSQHDELEEIRFILKFRQTSRKRGPGWNSFNGDHEVDPEAVETPPVDEAPVE